MSELNEASLIAAEHERRAALSRNDIPALEAMTADCFYYAHISGLVEDRKDFFDRLDQNRVTLHQHTASDLMVRMRKGYAILTGLSLLDYEWDTGEKGVLETLFLSVWEPGDGRWMIAGYASSPVKADLKAFMR
jgi:hypothetical protein